MSYEKQTWENLPSQISPFSAERMNHIEEGIKEIDDSLTIAKYKTDGTNFDDPDTTTEALILTTKNTPVVGRFYYIKTMIFGGNDSKPRTQVAIGYDTNEMWQRYYNGETWGEWKNPNGDFGTWTPEINTLEYAKPTVTYTEQSGNYIRVGDMVWVSFYLRGNITALNGTNNYAIVTGLPYVVADGSFGRYPLTIGNLYDLVTSDSNAVLNVSSNTIRVQNGYGAGATTLKVTTKSYFMISGSGWYPIKNK